jgi:hypothetical protein
MNKNENMYMKMIAVNIDERINLSRRIPPLVHSCSPQRSLVEELVSGIRLEAILGSN